MGNEASAVVSSTVAVDSAHPDHAVGVRLNGGQSAVADASAAGVSRVPVLRLSFEELNRRVDAMPEGPISVLNSPRWQKVLDRLGLVPLLGCGLLWLSLTMQWLTPAEWMVPASRYSILAMTLLWLPGFIRSVWVLVQDMRKGTGGFMQQWDHDLMHIEALQDWLLRFPRDHLEQRLLQCRQLIDNLQRKLGLFMGAFERWGILPVLAAVFFLLQEQKKLLELPGWMILLGIAIPTFWLIAMNAARVRLRLALMADLLDGALRRESSR